MDKVDEVVLMHHGGLQLRTKQALTDRAASGSSSSNWLIDLNFFHGLESYDGLMLPS